MKWCQLVELKPGCTCQQKNKYMKKYTVVFSKFFQTGSHTNSTVDFVHLTVPDGGTIKNELQKYNFDMTKINIVFENHCQEANW